MNVCLYFTKSAKIKGYGYIRFFSNTLIRAQLGQVPHLKQNRGWHFIHQIFFFKGDHDTPYQTKTVVTIIQFLLLINQTSKIPRCDWLMRFMNVECCFQRFMELLVCVSYLRQIQFLFLSFFRACSNINIYLVGTPTPLAW